MTADAAVPGTASISYVVGIDVGGTKTRLMRAPIEGEVMEDIVVSSSSWRGPLGDFEADAAGLSRLLTDHFGSDLARSAVAVGTHGCENTAQCRELESALRQHLTAPVCVVNDSELIAPAMGAERAIGMVVGTGSIATARDQRDELVTAGGWGWILGDEGSAPSLVREATRAALSHLDDGHPIEALGQRLMAPHSARATATNWRSPSRRRHRPTTGDATRRKSSPPPRRARPSPPA